MQERQGAAPPRESEARYRVVYRVAIEAVRPMLRSQADAEDIAHETWLAVERALSAASDDEDIRNFEAWVRRIAVNRAINLYKSRWSRVLRSQVTADEPLGSAMADETQRGPEAFAELRQYEARLAEAVDALAEPFRRAFVLYYRGHSYEEIAQLLESPVGTIKARVFRAREKLADVLHPEHRNPDGEPER